jgi:gag-polypeptide of LTR copia-type/Zinc knuckle
MTDVSTIRVIPSCGKVDEWPWSEKFLAKAKRYGFKDLLQGKLSIPKFDESFDEDSDERKKMLIHAEINEVAFIELILSIDTKSSEGKDAFNWVKGCKSKEDPDGNAATAWERLKNKFDTASAPSMVKLEKQFRTLSLKKGANPEVWITELEDLRIRLEDMDSIISDNQFMIHVLNNLTTDYDLQLALMEKRVGDSEKLLSIEEIKAELGLRFERFNISSNQSNENVVLVERAFFSGQYKEKCSNCGQIGHKAAQCKKKQFNHVRSNGNMTEGNYCTYCRRTGHVKKNCFKLKKKELQNININRGSNDNSSREQQCLNTQDMAFVTTSENETLTNEIWICDSGACGHYCNFKEGLMNVKEICDKITVGNGKTMTATKVGDLKCKVIQLDRSSLDVTLYWVKYVPELWMKLFSLNKALKNGYILSNKGLSICLSKDPRSVTFDRVIRTTNGFVSGIKLSIYPSSVICNAMINAEHNKSIAVNKFDRMMSHCGVDKLQKTADIHVLKLTGKLTICKN